MPRPIKTKYNADHFGFYEVGPFKVYSKLEAIEISVATGHKVKWNFNNEVFDNFNWTVEPEGTLEFWYAERAKQLREKYDYIVLLYSGGADSWNMLNAFVKNNIYIDEIAHYIVLENTPNTVDSIPNEEVYKTSYPTAKKLIETNPTYRTTKHRIIDSGLNYVKIIASIDKEEYFYTMGNNYYGPWASTIGRLRVLEPDYINLSDRKKSVCFLWGYDKPLVDFKDGKFKLRFSENALGTLMPPSYQKNKRDEWVDETFYWTPDMPELTCKQGHVLKNFVSRITDEMVDNVFVRYYDPKRYERPAYKVSIEKNNKKFELTTHGAHTAIYPGWDYQSIVRPKAFSVFFAEVDHWWFKQKDESNWYVRELFKLRERIKKIAPEWWHYPPPNPLAKTYTGGLAMFHNTYPLN